MRSTRRRFLEDAARDGAALGASLWFGRLPPVAAEDARVPPGLVQLRPEIAPLVRLLDETPRERCVEVLVGKLRSGVPYRHLVAAAFLTAVQRGGHHSVYIVHSAHQLSLDLGPHERYLPLFRAVDTIKEHLERFGNQRVAPLRGELPAPEKAASELSRGMETWDSERAERAVVALSRGQGPRATMERLWHYAGRDWSFIGHLAIAVASAWRTLETIGWQHAEPVLRYVIRQLHQWNRGKLAGQSYGPNLERVDRGLDKLPPGWTGGAEQAAATLELHAVLREGDWPGGCEWACRNLTEGKVSSRAVWDAVHLTAAEFMVRFRLGGRRIGNRALHSNTSANALHYAFRTCAEPRTRFLILLQAVAWVASFIRNEKGREMLRDLSIHELPSVELPEEKADAVEAIFSLLPPREFRAEIEDRSAQDKACQLAFALANASPDPALFLATARRLLARKATLNAHDVKYPVAVFEDLNWVSPRWRPHFLAASVHFLHGERMEDSAVTRAAHDALRSP